MSTTFSAKQAYSNESLQNPGNQDGYTRRDWMRSSLATIMAAPASTSLSGLLLNPTTAVGHESHRNNGSYLDDYNLKDLEKCLDLWQKQEQIRTFPTIENFSSAVSLAREAVCKVYHVNNNTFKASHSGFIIEIPQKHMTTQSRGKKYVVTCDHARISDPNTYPLVVLPDGKVITPLNSLVTPRQGANGMPSKDLRIFECSERDFGNSKGLPIETLREPLDLHYPVMTYQPLNFQESMITDYQSGKFKQFRPSNMEKPYETFILTHICNQNSYENFTDPNYPANSGFGTEGQLHQGGSGSPSILFTADKFFLAGYQVAYHPDKNDQLQRIDGELECDGRVVHINNAIELLKSTGHWK